jgi:hypothetical protein
MKKKPTKIVELVISDESQEMTIDAISLVTSPAIEQDFVFFGKEKNNLTLAKIDEEKRMLVSPALIPNKNIFRYDPNTDSDYYVYFSKETVRQASELYLKHNNHHKATYQHEENVSGVLTIESWIKEGDMDKSKLYGFDLPDGTWFVKMKIENDEMWSKIKDGELKGLSIEGYFINKMEKMGKQQFSNEDVLEALSELIKEKTKLKAEKIELANIKELDKFVKALKNAEKQIKNNKSKLGKSLRDIQAQRQEVEKQYNTAVENKKAVDLAIKNSEILSKEIVKQAKELGINPSEIPNVKELINLIEEVEGAQETIDMFMNTAKGIINVSALK